jgi:virginiamycin B lyase
LGRAGRSLALALGVVACTSPRDEMITDQAADGGTASAPDARPPAPGGEPSVGLDASAADAARRDGMVADAPAGSDGGGGVADARVHRRPDAAQVTAALTYLSLPPLEGSGRFPTSLAAGPDGTVWVTEPFNHMVSRVAPGAIQSFTLPGTAYPTAIDVGPDGTVWFTENCKPGSDSDNNIGKIDPRGTLTRFPIPTACADASGIDVGPDGQVWFTEDSGRKIGRLTPDGSVQELVVPPDQGLPYGIVVGAEGNAWYTARSAVGRVTPAGAITGFPVERGVRPLGIAAGSDGASWFTAADGAGHGFLGRVTPAGAVTLVDAPFDGPSTYSGQRGLAVRPDGELWVAGGSKVPAVFRVSATGDFTAVAVPKDTLGVDDVAVASDGQVYFTHGNPSGDGSIGRFRP